MIRLGQSLVLGLVVLGGLAGLGATEAEPRTRCVALCLQLGDLNDDGALDREEFIAYRLLALDGMVAFVERQAMSAPGSPNRQPYASPEVKRLRLQRIQGRADSEARFLRADRNGDDRLDRRELSAFCAASGR